MYAPGTGEGDDDMLLSTGIVSEAVKILAKIAEIDPCS